MSRSYRDFDLLIERIEDRYRARVFGASTTAIADFDDPRKSGSSTRDIRRSRATEDARLMQLGDKLFSAIFQENIKIEYRAALKQARVSQEGIRIRLQLTEVPELNDLPWEALYDSEEGQYLGLMREVSLVRYRASKQLAPLKVRPPLRVLGVLANPQDTDKLAVEEEWQRIELELSDLLKAGLVEVYKLYPGTLEKLLAYLERNKFHILHFIGHGIFDPEDGGQIMLESKNGASEPLDEHRLATALQRHGQIRLAVINACHGARAARGDKHSGLTRRLLQMGVPAVIAMTTKIGDRPAVDFASRLYRNLASGSSIEDAFGEARSQLYLLHKGVSWATPSLSLVTTDPDLLGLALGSRSQTRSYFQWTALILLLSTLIAYAVSWSRGEPENVSTKATSAKALKVNPQECPPPEGIDLKMVLIRAGMQHRDEPPGAAPLIVESDFCLGIYEVTQQQWETLLPEEENPSAWTSPRLPVGGISREDANLFLDALNDRTANDPFRLPTEIEWEYAARAGSHASYSFGTEMSDLDDFGNCLSVSGADGYDGTAPVGQKNPNAWDLYDMHGNVWEWVEKATATEALVLRGGSYESSPEKCEVTSRNVLSEDSRRKSYGFRVAREPVGELPTN